MLPALGAGSLNLWSSREVHIFTYSEQLLYSIHFLNLLILQIDFHKKESNC